MTLSDEKIKQIFQLRKEGKSLREIERLTGVPKTKVGETLKNENTVLESLEIKNYCIWGSECKKICTEECKSYFNAICNKKASERTHNYLKEHREELSGRTSHKRKEFRRSINDQEDKKM